MVAGIGISFLCDAEQRSVVWMARVLLMHLSSLFTWSASTLGLLSVMSADTCPAFLFWRGNCEGGAVASMKGLARYDGFPSSSER